MSLVADFSVPATAFCLAETLDTSPGMRVEFDRLVAYGPDFQMPFLWVLGDDWDAFERSLAADETVAESTVTDSFDDARLYQIEWSDVVTERLHVILDHDGVILEAKGAGREWRLWVRFGSREHFGQFREHFETDGRVTLHKLVEPTTPRRHQYGVSDQQREALIAAYDAGYFAVPRAVTGSEIADALQISQQAVSGRLRRGMSTLIESTLKQPKGDDERQG